MGSNSSSCNSFVLFVSFVVHSAVGRNAGIVNCRTRPSTGAADDAGFEIREFWRPPAYRCRYLAQATPFVMRTIKTIADLDKLRDQECAVVFIWVDWAIHARLPQARRNAPAAP
jgi:hypothetical protein